MLGWYSFQLISTSFTMLAKLFYFCRCLPLLCFSLVLFLLFLGVGFKLNLAPSWGCLCLVSHAFICFIGSLEPSRMKSGRLFTYPLIKLFEIWRMSWHGSFSSCCFVDVCTIFERVVQVIKRFMFVSRGLRRATNLLFRRSLLVLHVRPVFHSSWGKFFVHLFSSMLSVRESRWVHSCYQSSPAHDTNYSFGGHCCCPSPVAPPSFKPCPSIYFWLSTWTHFCLE